MENKYITLGELSIGGKGFYGIPASASVFTKNSYYRYLRITDIFDDGTLDNSSIVSLEDKNAQNYELKKNDIVFARTGNSTGRNYFCDGNEDKPLVYAGFLIKFSLNPSKVNPRFIKYYCLSADYKNWVTSFSTGSTRGNINAQTYASMPIPIIPRSVQDKIVSILDSLSLKISNNKKINDNLAEQMFALFESVNLEGALEKKASDFFEITIGKTPPRAEQECFTVNPIGYKWVSIADMGSSGTFILDTKEHLTNEAVDKYNVKVVPANTVLLSFKLTLGRVCITNSEMTTNEAIAHFRLNSDTELEYLYCYLKKFKYENLGSTSSIATAVNSKMIKAMPFVMPSSNELEKFHKLAAPLIQQIRNLQLENEKLADLRDSLLPKLLSGEIEL